jgi:predicted DNA-binding transcriptional regulator YafY
VETLPLHEGQEVVRRNDREVIFRYHLVPSFEFVSRILGWGDQVKVVSPASFRKEIVRLLHTALGRYMD